MTVAGLLCCRKMIASLNHMGFIMTPEQKRLLHPLTHQIPTQKALNLAAAVSLAWPFSIARTWLLTYSETFSAMFDPICLHAACGQDIRKKLSPTEHRRAVSDPGN